MKLFADEEEEKDKEAEIDREKEKILEIVKEEERHRRSDVLIAGVLAGAIAGFSTNAIEVMTVIKQKYPHFNVTKYILKRKHWHDLLLSGVLFRTFYYGSQACMMFFLLEEFKIYLKCDKI